MTGVKRLVDGKMICIGIEYFQYRKKPGLGVMIGNNCYKVASFNNEYSARFFLNNLAKLIGIAPNDWNWDDISWGLNIDPQREDHATD